LAGFFAISVSQQLATTFWRVLTLSSGIIAVSTAKRVRINLISLHFDFEQARCEINACVCDLWSLYRVCVVGTVPAQLFTCLMYPTNDWCGDTKAELNIARVRLVATFIVVRSGMNESSGDAAARSSFSVPRASKRPRVVEREGGGSPPVGMDHSASAVCGPGDSAGSQSSTVGDDGINVSNGSGIAGGGGTQHGNEVGAQEGNYHPAQNKLPPVDDMLQLLVEYLPDDLPERTPQPDQSLSEMGGGGQAGASSSCAQGGSASGPSGS
jgi:hypothetical protein